MLRGSNSIICKKVSKILKSCRLKKVYTYLIFIFQAEDSVSLKDVFLKIVSALKSVLSGNSCLDRSFFLEDLPFFLDQLLIAKQTQYLITGFIIKVRAD